MTFLLDTSGMVDADDGQHIALDDQLYIGVGWGILSPFTQGYIEALFASEADNFAFRLKRGHGWPQCTLPGFSSLAPETLARIIADCEAWCAAVPSRTSQRQVGGDFWRLQQAGKVAEAEALTVQLGDDGKVRFV